MEAMTKTMRKQAVAVAKDVLKSLRVMHVATGSFVRVDEEDLSSRRRKEVSEASKARSSKVQAAVLKKTCNVCALGSMLLSTVCLYNKFDFKKANGYDSDNLVDFDVNVGHMIDRLKTVFTPLQLVMIENAFERGHGYYHLYHDTLVSSRIANEDFSELDANDVAVQELIKAAVEFGYQFDKPKDRLRAIMKNIVRNDGEFVPPHATSNQ